MTIKLIYFTSFLEDFNLLFSEFYVKNEHDFFFKLNTKMECQVKWIHLIWMHFTIDIYFLLKREQR